MISSPIGISKTDLCTGIGMLNPCTMDLRKTGSFITALFTMPWAAASK